LLIARLPLTTSDAIPRDPKTSSDLDIRLGSRVDSHAKMAAQGIGASKIPVDEFLVHDPHLGCAG